MDVAIFFRHHTLDDKLSIIHTLQKIVHKEIDLVTLNEVRNLFLLESYKPECEERFHADPMFEGALLH